MMKVWFDAAILAAECQSVVALRMMKLMSGGRAGEREARRMIEEKFHAAAEAGMTMWTGGSAGAVVKGYRRRVRRNARRLSRG